MIFLLPDDYITTNHHLRQDCCALDRTQHACTKVKIRRPSCCRVGRKKRPGKKNLSQGRRRRHTSHRRCKIFTTFFAFSGTLCLFGWKKNNHIDNELIPGVGHFHQDVPNTKFKSKQFTGRR